MHFATSLVRWVLLLFLLLLFVVAPSGATTTASTSPPSVYPVQEHLFEAVIDHFNFRPTTPVQTFPLRYYVHDEHWNTSRNTSTSTNTSGGGVVFFYAGNEADIFQFINNSGFLFEAAAEFAQQQQEQVLVVFAEHRYYGRSNPFGDEYALGVPYNISFLTVEQALADFNTLNVHIRTKWQMPAKTTAFVAFGGSYGANLALWLRLRNPNLWAGAIASSATPLKHLLRETNDFARIETEVYANVSAKCPDLVRLGWKQLYDEAAKKSRAGREAIVRELHLCPTSMPKYDDDDDGVADNVHGWISGALETMVQYGYPYPTSFYQPVPAFPFRVACLKMLELSSSSFSNNNNNNDYSGLRALYAAATVYYNSSGQAGNCFDFNADVVKEAQKHWQRKGQRYRLYEQSIRIQKRKQQQQQQQPASLKKRRRTTEQTNNDAWTETDRAWGYQTCTEVYQPMPTNGITDFEIPYTPNATEYYENCRHTWGVEPRPDWEEMEFMGADIGAGSNIFLTNGQLDPWRAAGIQTAPKGNNGGSIIVRMIENGAHHLDLRAAHPLDPASVVKVRNEEKEAIRKWIAQWREIHS